MFLKRIELNGFKSFADKTVIPFENRITGIVGPNGCGKSNITDAIRWVLGEQSVNSLRGDKNMASIIFSGSASHRTLGAAEVKLVFDNADHVFDTPFEEVEITRRIIRKDNESEYYINGQQCRLKDILDLTMDSGLAKDGMNIITQGNISSFADAKPEYRRAVLEEAAGVAKYKKKKTEAINKLSRTQANLERAQDILEELEAQVIPLANAAEKARKYSEIKQQLEMIETGVLVQDIDFYSERKQEAERSEFDLNSDLAIKQTTLNLNENQGAQRREEMTSLDERISKQQEELLVTINRIQNLEARRIEMEEKRKYNIEKGSDELKREELQKSLAAARFEYENRKKAFDELSVEISLKEKEQNQLILAKIDNDQQYNEATNLLKRLENRAEVLKNIMERPFSQYEGVQAVMDAIASLPGVMGVVAEQLHPEEGYEEAISTALGGALYNIVTKDPESARYAIEFLKRNQSGRATFLPVSVLKERFISEQDEIIVSQAEGYLGIACDFVTNEAAYDVIRDNLLGSVVVAKDLVSAQNIADLIHYRNNVVTLEGEIIYRGGSLSGGKQKNTNSYMSLRRENEQIRERIEKQQQETEDLRLKKEKTDGDKSRLDDSLWEMRVNLAKAEPLLDVSKARYESLLADMQLTGDEEETEEFSDSVLSELEELRQKRQEIETSLSLNRKQRLTLSTEQQRKEQQMSQTRREISEIQEKLQNVRIDMARLDVLLNQNMERLSSEYHMTYEFAKEKVKDQKIENAKEEVASLRRKIDSMGSINMDAPKEYEEKSKRYEELKKNYDELDESRNKILDSITELDELMKNQFSQMFERVNANFSQIFTDIFGGGYARLYLEEADDPLESGVEIEAHPPGKLIRSNRVLSGGEKTLVAFCALFAIMKSRVTPLCVLDEVDTALDPANNERFAEYINNVTDTQFVIITHHTATMSRCDALYGVTMAQDGISSVLSVQLADARNMLEGE